MPTRRPTLKPLLDALARLGVIPAAAAWFESHLDEISAELQAMMRDEIPAFLESGNPDIAPEQRAHAAAHVQQILRFLGGSADANFEFVRNHAARRAEQRFPLEATLHAYRIGHRVLAK